jgi:5-methylcytosine-specific restriction endonuclease McrA
MSWKTQEAYDVPRGYEGRYHKEHFYIEVDHKIAVALGGDMWDESNLQPLCNICHKSKTKKDMKSLKKQRKDTKLKEAGIYPLISTEERNE